MIREHETSVLKYFEFILDTAKDQFIKHRTLANQSLDL